MTRCSYFFSTLFLRTIEFDWFSAMDEKRFIIVDDSTPILRITKWKLEVAFGKDVIVLFAYDGQEAVELFQKLVCDGLHSTIVAILMDYHMPRCSGIQAISEIRDIEKKKELVCPVSIVGFSADLSTEVTNTMLDAGANYTLAKPTEKNALESLCKEIISKRSATTNAV